MILEGFWLGVGASFPLYVLLDHVVIPLIVHYMRHVRFRAR